MATVWYVAEHNRKACASIRCARKSMHCTYADWLSYTHTHRTGHQFALRHGHGNDMENYKESQRAPIFLQWLDAVWQLMVLHPTAFEWNEHLLITISEELFSCRFGTFLMDCVAKRREAKVYTKTLSLWAYLQARRKKYINPAYEHDTSVLGLDMAHVTLQLWGGYHLRWKSAETRALKVSEQPPVTKGSSSTRKKDKDDELKDKKDGSSGWNFGFDKKYATIASRLRPGGSRQKVQSMMVESEPKDADNDEAHSHASASSTTTTTTTTTTATASASASATSSNGASSSQPPPVSTTAAYAQLAASLEGVDGSRSASSSPSTPHKRKKKRKTSHRTRAATASGIERPTKQSSEAVTDDQDQADE
jgi:hypothetical protein